MLIINSSRLTPLDGDPVGTVVGLDEGEVDGPFDGDNEGPLVGSEVIGEREGEVVGWSVIGRSVGLLEGCIDMCVICLWYDELLDMV